VSFFAAYGGLTAAEVVAKGHHAVESSSPHWYFTHPPGWRYAFREVNGSDGKPPHKEEEQWCGFGCKNALGWSMCHHDPGEGVAPELLHMVLGAARGGKHIYDNVFWGIAIL
jgi:hypothetical protein